MTARAAARKSSPRKAAPRKAAPRKAARPRAAARTGGDVLEDSTDEVLTSPPSGPVSAATPANQAVDLTPLADDPYEEGIDRYSYLPKDGSPAIVFPAFYTRVPSRHFIWSIYKRSELLQGIEWMQFFEVPPRIQERVMLLPDDEYQAFWKGWFQPLVPNNTPSEGGPPGES